jgi:hypothetical protein
VRARLLGALAVLALLALLATRETGRAVTPESNPPRRLSPPAVGLAPPEPVAIESVRDPFRYGDLPVSAPPVRPAPVLTPPPEPTPAPEPAYRLVGVLEREGRLCAALSIGGEVVLLAPGESSGGVTVLAVQEDGIRVRGPDGRDEVVAQP